jgi:Family of unknown function (DUF6166)
MMVADDVRYSGLRGVQPGHGHGGAKVVGVARGNARSTLALCDDRFLQTDFEWGYVGAGPTVLAQAILNDFLGFQTDLSVGRAFMQDVIAGLPAEFELNGADIARWVNARLTSACVEPIPTTLP